MVDRQSCIYVEQSVNIRVHMLRLVFCLSQIFRLVLIQVKLPIWCFIHPEVEPIQFLSVQQFSLKLTVKREKKEKENKMTVKTSPCNSYLKKTHHRFMS